MAHTFFRISQSLTIHFRPSWTGFFLILLFLALINCVLPSSHAGNASAGSCEEASCVINIVRDNQYWYTVNPEGYVLNLGYQYIPSPEWGEKSCESSKYSISYERIPRYNGRAYLFGWTRAYFDGKNWTTFGGIPAKFFLETTTPFHSQADVILILDEPPPKQQIAGLLDSTLPNGCSNIPDIRKNYGPSCM